MNKVILVGRVGRDPETTFISSGTQKTSFTLATNKRWRGEKKTQWHNIITWSKTAELCEKYVKKGSLIGVTGEIQTRKWTDRDGNNRYTTEIIAHDVDFIDLGDRNDRGDGNIERVERKQVPTRKMPPPPQPLTQQQEEFDDDDDVPF